MKKAAFRTLGCKVNSYETEVMMQKLQEKGYQIVPFDEIADVYIVNTCTVTNIADRKSRQMLHRAKQKNPDAVVVAAGCYVQTGADSMEKDHSVDLVIGNNRKKDIAGILEKYFAEREERGALSAAVDGCEPADKTLGGLTVVDIAHASEYEEMQLKQTLEHTRAYIKIQDGCNQFCSYCAIPLARGRVRSRRAEDILREIRGMTERGYREVVLTGIHISSYGMDLQGEKTDQAPLLDLLEQIHETQGLERIRLGSLEPRIITEETARRLKALPKVCPHFHLSLQSGCDATLKRMNRHYTSREYYESVEQLRRAFDCPAITTDVIVGFPGETEEEFLTTENFLKAVGFYEMHIFKYSRRNGTAAAKMPGQVSEEIKTRRSGILLELEKEQSRQFRSHYIGKCAEILIEEKKTVRDREYLLGHTGDYVKIALDAGEGAQKSGRLLTVSVKDFLTDEILLGEETCRTPGMK